MRIIYAAAAVVSLLGAAPAFAQTAAAVHANAGTKVGAGAAVKAQPIVPGTSTAPQTIYQQNQQVQQNALQDTSQSQQRVQALSQRNQQLLPGQQSTGASVTPH